MTQLSSSSKKLGPGKKQLVVVCPTEYGGHIEHAADLAIALASREDVADCTLVTRPGARAYLGLLPTKNLRVLEVLPARRTSQGGLPKLLKAPLQVVDLVSEHRRIRSIVQSLGTPTVLVLESGKYPWPRVFGAAPAVEKVLMVHNAKPHYSQDEATFRQRILGAVERMCLNGVDRALTHGGTQLATIASYSATPTTAVPLPTSSALAVSSPLEAESTSDFAPMSAHGQVLCLGELRANKGIDLAIMAAGEAGVPLLVAGKSEDPEVARQLQGLAARFPSVTLVDKFLTAVEFENLLKTADLVVLPYQHFDAQSGVLSRAMRLGASVLATDLPALKDQAAGYQRISFAHTTLRLEFAQALQSAFELAQLRDGDRHLNETNSPGNDGADWAQLAAAALGFDTDQQR